MDVNRSKLLERAENARKESKYLDFKSEFNTTSGAQWCEVIKDIIAFANSGGGTIVFGVNDDGSNAAVDTSTIYKLDIADVTNKIEAYTGYQFADIEILEVQRHGDMRAAFIIAGADVPIVFTRPGADVMVRGKQKPAFAKGTIYFRHGAKSEPGTRDDLIDWREKTIERARSNWAKGMRKVFLHLRPLKTAPLDRKAWPSRPTSPLPQAQFVSFHKTQKSFGRIGKRTSCMR